MSIIEQRARRLADLERARANMHAFNHYDDAHQAQALALKYLRDTIAHELALNHIAAGLDNLIAEAKREMREALK